MTQQIDAIYDEGVLKPLLPLGLPDKARVKVTIEVASTSSPDDDSEIETANTSLSGTIAGHAGADFEAELDALLFDGPNLPADFSRADIYDDHD